MAPRRLTARLVASAVTLALAFSVGVPSAEAKRSCGQTAYTGSTVIKVWRSGSVSCKTARRVMRAHIIRGVTIRGWSCPDTSSYYYCRKSRRNARVYGRVDTARGE